MEPVKPQTAAEVAAARSSQLIVDINRSIGEAIGEYIKLNANGETPPPNAPIVTPVRAKSPTITIVTPESRRSKARRRLFAEADAAAAEPRTI